ncbi:streptogrisin C [Sphingomonas sp. UYAg733]
MLRLIFGVLLTAAMAVSTGPAFAQTQPSPPVISNAPLPPPSPPPAPAIMETPADAIARDAAEYAKQFGVPVAEAVRRLTAQEESVAATDRIEEMYRDRLAGIAIEHKPAYRILVYLTGDVPVAAMGVRAGGTTVPIIFRTGAKVTRDRVIWAMTWHQAEIRAALPSPPSMGLDPRTGELVVIVGGANAAAGADALKAKFEGIAGVPVRIRMVNQVDVNLDVAGGSRVDGVSPVDGKRYLCTTGFNVSDGQKQGVTTAAHCLDALSYRDPQHGVVSLDFIAQWGWGYRDLQINGSTGPLPALFYADTAKTRLRPVTGQRTRAATRAGDFVCHRGERTGFSCALVELTDFAPAGDICGGACLPTWVTVSGPTCKGGDSGSPVFSGTTAFGILKGGSYRRDGSCAFYFYMSVDYLPPGWSLLRADPVGVPAGAPARGAR